MKRRWEIAALIMVWLCCCAFTWPWQSDSKEDKKTEMINTAKEAEIDEENNISLLEGVKAGFGNGGTWGVDEDGEVYVNVSNDSGDSMTMWFAVDGEEVNLRAMFYNEEMLSETDAFGYLRRMADMAILDAYEGETSKAATAEGKTATGKAASQEKEGTQEKERVITCIKCDGTGICPKCEGMASSGSWPCAFCKKNPGMCRDCDGKGMITVEDYQNTVKRNASKSSGNSGGSSSGSAGGSSSGGAVGTPCTECAGTGRCFSNVAGRFPCVKGYYYMNGKKYKCRACNGTGICSECGGTGTK